MQIDISDKQRDQVRAELVTTSQTMGGAQITIAGIEVVAHRAGFDLAPIKRELDAAEDLLSKAQKSHTHLADVLAAVGAIGPSGAARPVDDLAFLSTVGSDDSRELLEHLERALAVAERIDAARGLTVGDKVTLQRGESAGCDWAEDIALLALRARREALGGQSRHE